MSVPEVPFSTLPLALPKGADMLAGGKGSDRLRGASGNDGLTGGPGGDRFSGGPGTDVAADFKPAQGGTQDGTLERRSRRH
jgi:Ca2+-binding RTX toxin-like protein